ncbi:MAG: ABC transporter ATP-binding protein/permease [Bacilli bacterium]|nr:ABC transporter ATP-binding protein/permease [Bacilli bacterium]
MIILKNINKFYSSSQGKFHALKDITLTFPDQGMVYIVGKSGSGKSTLLNVIGGIDKYDSGQLIIENNVITDEGHLEKDIIDTAKFSRSDFNSYRNSYIGFIFQEFNVIKGLTVYQNVALSLELQKKSVKENHENILNIIEKVGLLGKENRRINELSGGERQRVAIARALIKDPKVIIADEPTGNLDSKNRDIVMNILKELSKEKLIIIVTHDKHLSQLYGDRQIKIKDGQIVGDEIFHQENLNNNVPTKHKLKQISPKARVSFNLAWIGFKLNLLRFIFIILLFSISLVFAGSVINLYLTDTTKEYATFQYDYKNIVISLSDKYNYHNEISNSAFFTTDFEDIKEYFTFKDEETGVITSLTTYKRMNINIPIDKKLPADFEPSIFYRNSIENVTVYEDRNSLKKEFKVEELPSVNTNYSCYITDYLAKNLLMSNYFDETVKNQNDVLGKLIEVPGMVRKLQIEGIIYTDYYEFNEQDSNLRLAAFEDNLTIYNSIFISAEKYKTIFSAQNLSYYYDDMVFYKNEKTERFNNMKYSRVTSSDVFLSGNAPDKPKQGEITQIAVSKGFIEQVLDLNVNSLAYATDSKGQTRLQLNGLVYNFYMCGVSHIPTQTEFNITGVIDSDEIICYAPGKDTESTLYSNWINMALVNGGFLTVKISDNPEDNSIIYRNLLDNDITINNPSFKKLQLVDDFINDNIFLFAALFFVFCLFSTLMIFNFIIINIKNSTRDIGIYMSLGMNGFKISLIYLFQVMIISTIAMIIGLIGSTILLSVVDYSFASRVIVNFDILHNTVYGIGGVILLAYLTPIIAIAFPLFSLSRKKPIDVIKVS